MKRRRLARRRLRQFCAEVGSEDGVDPRDERQPAPAARVVNRKALQLCRQARDTLNLVLAGECDDEALTTIQVVAVRPAPNASQLLVVVAPAVPEDSIDPQTVVEKLEAASGMLRREVAAAINRRRAPRLVFAFASDG